MLNLSGRLSGNIDLSEPAGGRLEASGDFSWGGPDVDRNLYGIMLTYNRAAVHVQTKKVGLIIDSTHEGEAVATSKASEPVVQAREALRALGEPDDKPTLIVSDNKANVLVANDAASASRSKHFLRRYHTLQQRIACGDVIVAKLDDANMPSDFLTKWIPAKKLAVSVRYATNSGARPAEPAP